MQKASLFLCLILSNVFLAVTSSDYALRISISGQDHTQPIDKTFIKTLPPAKKSAFKVEPLTLCTNSGIKFPAIFVDNKSKYVLVLGQAFPGSKESMKAFIQYLGSEFDYIIFDYRWVRMFKFVCAFSTVIHPFQKFLGEEQEEVFAVVDFLHSKENERQIKYKEIVALGECYSDFVFVKAQALAQQQGRPFFTRLILDSCWLSLKDFVNNICFDPCLPCSPQEGGSPMFIKKFLALKYVHETISAVACFLTPQVSIEPYLSQLKNTPTLFIRGQSDLMVSNENFEKIWQATASDQKVALFTPRPHSDNFREDTRQLYLHFVKLFVMTGWV